MKRTVARYIFNILLFLGLIIFIPSLYQAASSFGIIQTIGSLFGGDLRQSDGFARSRGGFEGAVYTVAAIDAIGIIVGGCLVVIGLLGIIRQHMKNMQ